MGLKVFGLAALGPKWWWLFQWYIVYKQKYTPWDSMLLSNLSWMKNGLYHEMLLILIVFFRLVLKIISHHHVMTVFILIRPQV